MSTPKLPSKKDLILETAGNLFMQNGFQAVSMDQIAAAVPVSKPTLYTNFKDKRELFAAVIGQRCEAALYTIRAGIAEGLPVEESLRGFAHQFVELLLSTQALQFHRVIIGESESFPDMAQMFYETGPKQMHALLTGYLEQLNKDGVLKIEDAAISADIFLGMIKGRMHLKCLLGINKGPSKKERDHLVQNAVRIFVNGQKP